VAHLQRTMLGRARRRRAELRRLLEGQAAESGGRAIPRTRVIACSYSHDLIRNGDHVVIAGFGQARHGIVLRPGKCCISTTFVVHVVGPEGPSGPTSFWRRLVGAPETSEIDVRITPFSVFVGGHSSYGIVQHHQGHRGQKGQCDRAADIAELLAKTPRATLRPLGEEFIKNRVDASFAWICETGGVEGVDRAMTAIDEDLAVVKKEYVEYMKDWNLWRLNRFMGCIGR
jgi:hypothetical protein